mmetsp:Transcript_56405/g.132284  ORF Transcript_56405/g.132284 Transcript_56405/m.132284 type:complete len:438 (-) Transcript_56405:52-1365(-)
MSKKSGTSHWEVAWSAERNRWYYQDRAAGKSQWERPPDFTGKVPDKPPETTTRAQDKELTQNLDPRWQAVYDPSSKKYYYYDRINGERTWFKPAGTVQSDVMRKEAGREQRLRKHAKGDVMNTFRWSADHYAARLEEAQRGHHDPKLLFKVLQEMKSSNADLGESLKHPGTADRGAPVTVELTSKACQDAILLGLVEDLGTRARPRISFSSKSMSSALAYFAARDKRVRVCGVNAANGTKPGGGYTEGDLGDEEDLCRRIPLLFPSLLQASDKGMYPFGPATMQGKNPGKYSNVLFTPNVCLARGPQEAGFPILSEEQRQLVSIVSGAPPNISKGHDIKFSEVENTLRSMLIAAPMQEPITTVIVFGLWGCSSPEQMKPSDVAEILHKVLFDQGLGRLYDEIHFAVPRNEANSNDPGTQFRKTFEQKISTRIEEVHI